MNHFVLTSGAFDGVIDFSARATADPANPLVFNPAFERATISYSNHAGYLAMANAVSLGACWMNH